MKQSAETNSLCLSCRRTCKQASAVLIAACPRYYQGPKLKRVDWKQMALPMESSESAAPKPDKPAKER